MAENITLSIIKPDALKKGHTGQIIKMIEEAGFEIKAIKLTKISEEKAGKFYEVHQDKPFYNELKKYMSSGPIIPFILQKDNAIEDFRKLIGATDPAKAEKGTIRNLFATSIEANAIHGSDSEENALRESRFFFSELEVY